MTKNMMFKYRLPNGTYTGDVDKYTETWRELGEDVCTMLPGSFCWCFDPGLGISREGASFGTGTDIPADMALEIQKLVRFKRRFDKLMEIDPC